MTLRRRFVRVSTSQCCPVCNRPDWCLLDAENPHDPAVVICPRVESGHRCGEAGWLHRLRPQPGRSTPRFAEVPVPTGTGTDLVHAARGYERAASTDRLRRLAHELGVSVASLARLSVGWNGWAWTFPMVDAGEKVVGFRLRTPDGKKLSVRGGHEGIFLPTGTTSCERLFVCEGPTDVASLLDLGVVAVGRPSCCGGGRILIAFVPRLQPGEVVVVADNDPPGLRGAKALAAALAVRSPSVRVITPPRGIKDARDWKRHGATLTDLESAIDATPPVRLAVSIHRIGA